MGNAHYADIKPPVDPNYELSWMDGDLAFHEAATSGGFGMGLAVAFEHQGEIKRNAVRARADLYDGVKAQEILLEWVERTRG